MNLVIVLHIQTPTSEFHQTTRKKSLSFLCRAGRWRYMPQLMFNVGNTRLDHHIWTLSSHYPPTCTNIYIYWAILCVLAAQGKLFVEGLYLFWYSLSGNSSTTVSPTFNLKWNVEVSHTIQTRLLYISMFYYSWKRREERESCWYVYGNFPTLWSQRLGGPVVNAMKFVLNAFEVAMGAHTLDLIKSQVINKVHRK